MRKVIVTGGRHYRDEARVFAVLDRVNPDVVIQGECPDGGADLLAKKWCRARGKPCIGMEAMWAALGRAAGPIRNGWMLEFNAPVSGVVAFPGGRGTADMVRQAAEAGIIIYRAE